MIALFEMNFRWFWLIGYLSAIPLIVCFIDAAFKDGVAVFFFYKSDSEISETLAIQNVAEMTPTLNGILVDKWLVHLRLTFLRHSFFNV